MQPRIAGGSISVRLPNACSALREDAAEGAAEPLKPGDVIEVKDKSKQMELVIVAAQLAERDVPDYIEADHTKMTSRMARVPGLAEVPYPVHMEPNLVIEFYSR